MRHLSRYGAIRSVLVALAVAEVVARALTPRERAARAVPIDVRSYFSEEEIARGRRFARPQMALALARAAVQLGVVIAALRGAQRRLPDVLERPEAGGAVAGAGLAVATTLPALPFAAIARRRSIAVGLVTQSWRGWAVDVLKSTGIEAGFAAGAGAIVVPLTRRYPNRWWLSAAAGSVLFGALLAALSPIMLDPIFNDFTPLPEGENRADVLSLAEAAGVRVREVYSVDASRRTTAANAYVTGLGPTKRVVLFDTLLDRYSRDEVRVVVAHELAHVRNRDVPRSVLFAALISAPGALAVQRVSWTLSPSRGTPAALPALSLAAALVAAPIGLIGNRLSRAVERRADACSLALSEAPEAFISFERSIALQNVADLKPPRWVAKVLATHPPTAERIGAAVAWRANGAGYSSGAS